MSLLVNRKTAHLAPWAPTIFGFPCIPPSVHLPDHTIFKTIAGTRCSPILSSVFDKVLPKVHFVSDLESQPEIISLCENT